MRITSAGNLGLGVTPSAWWSGFKAIQVGTTGAISSGSGVTNLGHNYYFDGMEARNSHSSEDRHQIEGNHSDNEIHSYAGIGHEGKLFGMNAGCLIDVDAYCFKYAKNMAINVNLGCGVVLNGVEAHFIPMHVDAHGRWTGKLN
jgi:hypothetical protein